jgi:hypothetical protein
MCDDCAYTGHQMFNIASFDYSNIRYPDKPPPPPETSDAWLEWFDDIVNGATQFIKKISIQQFSADLIIPWMSSVAQTRLHTLDYVKIPKKCIIFPTFDQRINMARLPTYVINEFQQTFQYHKEVSAIYFDHKVADAVSTFHKVYLLAPLFNCTVTNKSAKFIEGCPSDDIPDGIDVHAYHLNLEKTLKKDTCPGTFYKSIIYTYKNNSLKPDTQFADI